MSMDPKDAALIAMERLTRLFEEMRDDAKALEENLGQTEANRNFWKGEYHRAAKERDALMGKPAKEDGA